MDYLLATSALVYVTRLAFFFSGQWRNRRTMPLQKEDLPRVSVIVPARNEQQNIAACIGSLLACDYPEAQLEIIIVNDRSSDETGWIIDTFAASNPCIRALHRTESDAIDNLRGKPGALQFGVDRSTGHILLVTDADCRVHPNWIRTMVAPFTDSHTDMVCSFTTVRRGNAFALLQDIEWLYTSGMAMSANANGQPLGCFGNNIAVRATTFADLGGYRSIAFSVTEDLALMQAMDRRGSRIAFICEPTSRIETEPCLSLGEYLRQKQRWVQGGLGLGWRGYLFAASSAIYWFGLVSSIVTGSTTWLLVFLVLRILGDGSLILTSSIRLRRFYLLWAIAPSLLLLLLLELILPVLAFQKRVIWKGQTFGK